MRTERAVTGKAVVRDYAETRHKAKSWTCERRAIGCIEARTLGLDIRFVDDRRGRHPRALGH